MNNAGIKTFVENLSLEFILADASDSKALSGIRDILGKIRKIFYDDDGKDFPQLIRKACDFAIEELEEVIKKAEKDASKEVIIEETADQMNLISQIISALQSVIVDEKSPDRVEFPEELLVDEIPVDAHGENDDVGYEGSAFTPVEMINEDVDEPVSEVRQKESPEDETEEPGREELAYEIVMENDEKESHPSAGLTPREDAQKDSPPDFHTGETIRHPSKLPDYIDEKFFLEFLGLQGDVLDKIEALIIDLEKGENDFETIHELKRVFHTLKGEAGFLKLDDVEIICHKSEDIFEKITTGVFIDLFLSVKDWLNRAFNAYAGAGDLPEPVEGLLEKLDKAAKKAKNNGGIDESITETKDENTFHRETADAPAVPVESGKKEGGELRSSKLPSSLIRQNMQVDAERLDRLIDMIGELVIAETMVTQSEEIKPLDLPDFKRHLGQLDKITRELQRIGLSLRMMPIRSTFRKMSRIVRDLSIKSGKKINLVFSGEETELDKSLVDKIGDPLLHMVRNAVDHGIEKTAEERVNKGKPETARLEIRSFHKAGNIHIEVEDDGRGIDPEIILEKAVERGIVGEDEKPSEREIINLIFESGFSTAEVVTDVSGRGVGMDVVKKNIESMRGQVEVMSKPGIGSVFSIRLPLTLAIIDGMAVNVGEEKYIIPTLSIEMSIRPKEEHLTLVMDKGEVLDVQGRLIPVIRLYKLFNISGAVEDPLNALLVVVEEDGKKAGILVDRLLGKQQIVIKNLGESMQNIMGISGGAIMPDGSVGLILDIGGIIRLAYKSGAF